MERLRKDKAIEIILLELEKGIDRANCLAKIGKEWQISVRTFDRHWKEANTIYTERQGAIQEELGKDSLIKAKERLNKAILTKDERMEIASKIAKGEAWKVQNEIIIPGAGDRMKALDYLSKIEGDFAPKKVDHTTAGESLNKEPDPLAPVALTVNVIKRDADIQPATESSPIQQEATDA